MNLERIRLLESHRQRDAQNLLRILPDLECYSSLHGGTVYLGSFYTFESFLDALQVFIDANLEIEYDSFLILDEEDVIINYKLKDHLIKFQLNLASDPLTVADVLNKITFMKCHIKSNTMTIENFYVACGS